MCSSDLSRGDWKYLRIAGNEFLFDVVNDPRERADQKVRQAIVFNRLKTEWEAWEQTVLPPKPGIQPYRHPGEVMADHYGLVNPK